MELTTVRRIRRVLSAVVAASAILLVMARLRTSAAGSDATGTIASVVFSSSLVAFILVWRKEHAAAEAGFAERERQQLAALRLQVELAQLAAQKKRGSTEPSESANGAPNEPNGKDVTHL
jgi:hypothetical protein